ncbi:MAG: carbohydrate ABC transporter permease [Clostridia bacterium]|nr:carbohydrate ABC transporter permease [Clostridia bacterium]
MKRKTELSELIFRIVAYFFLIVFALMCVYPLIYVLSAAFSSSEAINNGDVVLWPAGELQAGAFKYVLTNNMFWVNYSNTIFVTFFGTVWSLGYSILGAYALSKKRLLGRHGWNFFLVFTMWLSAGIIPQYQNYMSTVSSLNGITNDLKWTVVIAMGMNATNIILLRNSFEGVPSEIEEAARIDGATEMQVLTKVYIPMSKATIATVALFFGISRWNGYFWAKKVMDTQEWNWPVQVRIRDFIQNQTSIIEGLDSDVTMTWSNSYSFAPESVAYAMVICAIIPILAIYPFIQKYFAKGVNMGGVKE